METITGASSLISWNNTKNTSGIKATPSHNDFIRKEYLRFFEGLKALEYTNNFCECWLKYCTSFEKSFVQSMNNFLIASEENILNIWYKFKGNVGEIFIEKLISEGIFNMFFSNNSYIPSRDRQNEDYTDGNALSIDKKFMVGVQIKNHSGPIKLEIFTKAGEMYGRTAFENMVNDPTFDFSEYVKLPRQFIISFSDKDISMALHHEYDQRVTFIGMKQIDKHMFNNRFGYQAYINDICKEIELF